MWFDQWPLHFYRTIIHLVERRGASSFSECKKENVTFTNNMEVSKVHIGIESGGNCEVYIFKFFEMC